VVGDIAIFLNFDSADVWTHLSSFHLDKNLAPEVVAGVPLIISARPASVGEPAHIDGTVMKQDGYQWWISRMRWATCTCDTFVSTTSADLNSIGKFRAPRRPP
jgi:4-alpha-glucanotransferase